MDNYQVREIEFECANGPEVIVIYSLWEPYMGHSTLSFGSIFNNEGKVGKVVTRPFLSKYPYGTQECCDEVDAHRAKLEAFTTSYITDYIKGKFNGPVEMTYRDGDVQVMYSREFN
jgi:hypothetical protein